MGKIERVSIKAQFVTEAKILLVDGIHAQAPGVQHGDGWFGSVGELSG